MQVLKHVRDGEVFAGGRGRTLSPYDQLWGLASVYIIVLKSETKVKAKKKRYSALLRKEQ